MSGPPAAQPAHRLLHVGFSGGAPTVKELEEHFNQATDWYRYTPSSWLLWTTGTPDSWFNYLHAKFPETRVLVLEVNTAGVRGFMPKGTWEWMTKIGIF